MDGRTSLALALALSIGIVIGLAVAGPAADTLYDAATDDADGAPAAGSAETGGERASGTLDAADEVEDAVDEQASVDGSTETVEVNASEEPTNASDEETDPDREPANATTRLTFEGPEQVDVDASEGFSGRLTTDGEGQPNATVRIRADGDLLARTQTNASGHYEVSLAFNASGEHELQALAGNASSELETVSEVLEVTVERVHETTTEQRWPTYRGDAARTGARGTTGPGNGSTVWTLNTELDVRGEPAVADGTVFVATSGLTDCCQPTLYAVNALTGEVLWTVQRVADFGAPIVHDETVLAVSGSTLAAYDRLDGDEEWSANVTVAGSPPSATAGNQAVYALTAEGESTAVTAVNVTSGETLWSQQLGGEPQVASPALANGTLYTAAGSSLHALDASSGDVLWSFEAEDVLVAAPAVQNGTVYTGSGSDVGKVYAVDAETGELAWWNTIDGSPADAIAVDGDRLFVDSANEPWVYAFAAGSGEYVWNQTTSTGGLGGPAVTDDHVYLADRGGTVRALDRADGAQVWASDVLEEEHERIVASPVVADGLLFAPVDDDCTGCTDVGLVALDAGRPVED